MRDQQYLGILGQEAHDETSDTVGIELVEDEMRETVILMTIGAANIVMGLICQSQEPPETNTDIAEQSGVQQVDDDEESHIESTQRSRFHPLQLSMSNVREFGVCGTSVSNDHRVCDNQ